MEMYVHKDQIQKGVHYKEVHYRMFCCIHMSIEEEKV